MTEPKLTTPVAVLFGILGAGAMIAVAVYVALARGPSKETPSSSPEPASGAAATAPLDSAAIVAEVERALEPQRAMLVEKCWKPGVARGGPDHADYSLEYTFGADGSQLARGFRDAVVAADAARPSGDVSGCVSRTLPAVTIAPRGSTVVVRVPLRLP